MRRITLSLVAAVLAATGAFGDAGILAPGAALEKLSCGFSFTEGPACDPQGNVYFTDQPNDRIWKWGTDDLLTVWVEKTGRSNGLCFDASGALWACADEKNQMWILDSGKQVKVVADEFESKLLNAPNDVWVAPDGSAYFTDPFYKRDYWTRGPSEQPCQGVYYISQDHARLVRVACGLDTPNGLIGTPDGKTLYVSDLGAGKTYSYTINADGSLSDKALFCEMGSDGMTVDDRGNVYLTGKGVFVFDRSGKQIEHIEVDEPWTANVCFGGKDRQSLFITASKCLYRIRTLVKGVGSQ